MSEALVSILIPMYNEEEYIAAVLRRVLAAPLPGGLGREIIVVDDGSTDGSGAAAEAVAAQYPDTIRILRHERNQGKGAAIRTALAQARGEFTLIQDADLEYNPREYPHLLSPLVQEKADAVYGSRFLVAGERRVLYFWHAFANGVLVTLVNLFADLNLTDVWTCYKAFRTEFLKSIPLRSDRFGFEPEITIKLAQRQAAIYETPISYYGRTYEEGKKIGPGDAVAALGTMLRFWLTRDIYQAAGPEILDALSGAPRFNKWMADTITPFVGQRVLEIGAGIGNLTRHLARRREKYVATDIDHEALARLRARLQHRPNLEVRSCDLTQDADFDELAGSVDTVICLNVVEHIEDDGKALANIHRTLAPGGRAIILVPEGMSIFGQLDVVLGHYRRYSTEELRSKMQQAGFEVEQVLEFNRVTRPGWWFNGRVLKRSTFSRFQIGVFNRLVWLWRRIDGLLPWKPTSIIAIGRKP
jgi:2-polyprenyl-3-methyl-5-hydroxy-6-metoxy-1,4-benzoquinol methylase